MHTLGLQDRFVKIGEMQTLTAILAMAHITAGSNELRAIQPSQLLEFGKQWITLKHGVSEQRP
jgi:hypothetical protein